MELLTFELCACKAFESVLYVCSEETEDLTVFRELESQLFTYFSKSEYGVSN